MPSLFLCLHVPEFPAQNLPHDALGKGGYELNQLGHLVSRKFFFAEVNDFFRRHGLTWLCDNKDLYGLSAIGIGNANGAHFQNLRMCDQKLVDLFGIDIEAAGIDNILLAVHNGDISVLIHETNIACLSQPSSKTIAVSSGLL